MNICVFCGSGTGRDPVFADAAKTLGTLFASNNHTLVYGGGRVGLMGILANSVLEGNGQAIGIIPRFLVEKEVSHSQLTRLEVVDTMHQRKARMAELSDAFVVLPGGIGTLDEMAEIATWRQLGLVHKPLGMLNTGGYFDPLLDQLHRMVEEQFLSVKYLNSLFVAAHPAELLSRLTSA